MNRREVTLKASSRSVVAGEGHKTLINLLIGANASCDLEREREKVRHLAQHPSGPEIITDLSIFRCREPLLQTIIDETQCIAATLPVYTVTVNNSKIDDIELLDTAVRQMEMGAGLLTIHPTPTHDIIAAAKRRLTPWTSRGGQFVIADLVARESTTCENAYLRILPELISAAQKHRVVLSLGASFRSANIFDANDQAQNQEIDVQLKLAQEIKAAGVGVIVESPGHARPSDIISLSKRLNEINCPIMPLGPIPTDIAIGQDHIASSIGVTLLGLLRCAHIISVVTRNEHAGGIPDLEALKEGLAAARIAAHIIDIENTGATAGDLDVAKARSASRSCIAGKGTSGCDRCDFACPLATGHTVLKAPQPFDQSLTKALVDGVIG